MSETMKKLKQIYLICSKCEILDDEGKLCRDIKLSEKLSYGCGEWKIEGLVLNQKFYDDIDNEVKKRLKLKSVIDDLIKTDNREES